MRPGAAVGRVEDVQGRRGEQLSKRLWDEDRQSHATEPADESNAESYGEK